MPVRVTFDTRAEMLTWEIGDDWEDREKIQLLNNQRLIREGIIHEFGAQFCEQKIQDFIELGAGPWSVIARHNSLMADVRAAFVSGRYYSALLGSAGLGERVLNELILRLRPYYVNHEATRHVRGKSQIDDWQRAIKTLTAWGVLESKTAAKYEELRKLRNASVHYRDGLEKNTRDPALQAIAALQTIIGEVFTPFGGPPMFIDGTLGHAYFSRETESLPLVHEFHLNSCVLVSPDFRMEAAPDQTFVVYDNVEYASDRGVGGLSDDQFAAALRG